MGAERKLVLRQRKDWKVGQSLQSYTRCFARS